MDTFPLFTRSCGFTRSRGFVIRVSSFFPPKKIVKKCFIDKKIRIACVCAHYINCSISSKHDLKGEFHWGIGEGGAVNGGEKFDGAAAGCAVD